MRASYFLLLFVASVPLVTPIATLTVFEMSAAVLELIGNLLETWDIVNDKIDLFETMDSKMEKLIFDKLDNINTQLSEITEKLNAIDEQVNTITKMVRDVPQQLRLELNLRKIQIEMNYLDVYYYKMNKFVYDYEKYENSTLIDFGNSVVSLHPNSVYQLIESIYRQVTNEDFLQLYSKRFAPNTESHFCNDNLSQQQGLLQFLNEMNLVNAKSYMVIQVAYMMKKMYGQGNFTKEIQNVNEEFLMRTNRLLAAVNPYISQASTELWMCDRRKHIEGETYVQVTNFLHGYIANKVNLDPTGGCREECDVFSFTKTQQNCNQDKWCRSQKACSKVLNCRYVDSSMTVCTDKTYKTGRRYSYIEYGNGRTFGKKKVCRRRDTSFLETYRDLLIWKCSYCFCICEEGEVHSDRYINLRAAIVNINDNRVVTGIRFVKHNKIIHLQIQEGQLLEHGKINIDTVQWVPVENYTIYDRYIYRGQDYHVLSWEKRAFELADIKTADNSVITGVRFKLVGSRINLEILTSPFNFTTGQLKYPQYLSQFRDDPKLQLKHKFGKELKLNKADDPTRAKSSDIFETEKYVQFTHTDLDKDAAQTTVPFFDAQNVVSPIPVPLSGIGIHHKGLRSGSGGFLAPRIFTYDFAPHLRRLNLTLETKDMLKLR